MLSQHKIIPLIVAIIFILSQPANSQNLMPDSLELGQGPISMTADEVTYWKDEDRYVASGHVVITTQGFVITCDELEVWNATGEMEARGNVRFKGEQGTYSAERMRFNSMTQKGVMVNTTLYIVDQHITLSGNRIEKIGPGRYLIQGASFTTCKCEAGERPDWSIQAGKLEARQGSYAGARNATFRVKGVPIIYIPFGIFPIGSERQSGFLVPRVAYSSRDNFEFVLPFYWAATRWLDVTIEEDFIMKRGIKQNLELRWALSQSVKGKLKLFYVDDWLVNENRYAGVFQGGARVWGAARINQEIRYASDNEYISDFRRDDVSDDPRARELESRILAVAPFKSSEAYILLSRIDDLVGDDVGARLDFKDHDNLVPNRYPRAGYHMTPVNIPHTPLYFRGRVQSDTFYRQGPVPAWDEPGAFHDEEWAERADVEPSVFLPLASHGMYFIPEVGFRETAWAVAGSDPASRTLGVGKAELGLRMWRIYRHDIKHTIEPRVRYYYTREIGVGDRPHFDLTDDLGDLNGVELNLDQRLYFSHLDSLGIPRGQEVARFEITQWVDLKEGEFRWLRGELETRPTALTLIKLDAKYDLHAGAFEYASADANIQDKRRDNLQVGYRYQTGNEQLLRTRAQVRVRPWIALTYFHYLDLQQNMFVDHGGGIILEPKSDCWMLDVSAYYHTEPKEIRYALRFVLVGLGSFGQ